MKVDIEISDAALSPRPPGATRNRKRQRRILPQGLKREHDSALITLPIP